MLPSPTKIRTKSRNAAADILKGIAVLLMIQVHVMEQFASPDVYNSLLGKISLFLGGPFCAPVFMAVMGYFLYAPHRKAGYFLRRGIGLIILGIFLNMARSGNLLWHIGTGESDLDPWFFIFGVDILPLAGLSMLLMIPLRLLFKYKPLPWIILALVIAAVTPWIPTIVEDSTVLPYIMAFVGGDYAWSYFPIFPWFAYVLVGYGFRLFINLKRSLMVIRWVDRHVLWIVLFAGILGLTLPWASQITHDLNGAYYHHGILFFIWVVIFLVVYVYAIERSAYLWENSLIGRLFRWGGIRVTAIYVIQWIIIGNLAYEFYQTMSTAGFFLWTAIIALSTGLITLGHLYVRGLGGR